VKDLHGAMAEALEAGTDCQQPVLSQCQTTHRIAAPVRKTRVSAFCRASSGRAGGTGALLHAKRGGWRRQWQLTQDLLAMRRARSEGYARSQREGESATASTLRVADSAYVDEQRTLDANESIAFEIGGEVLHRVPTDVFGIAGMELDVVFVSLNVLDTLRLEYVPTVLAFADENFGSRGW
jgi:hypothetical protein